MSSHYLLPLLLHSARLVMQGEEEGKGGRASITHHILSHHIRRTRPLALAACSAAAMSRLQEEAVCTSRRKGGACALPNFTSSANVQQPTADEERRETKRRSRRVASGAKTALL